jgi:hypothetical protein
VDGGGIFNEETLNVTTSTNNKATTVFNDLCSGQRAG